MSLDELRHQPDWVYLEDYDAYYLCRDDEETVIREVEVLDAAEQGDFYRLHYRARRNGQDPDGWHIPTYEVILKKNGDSYRFCANRLWMEKGLLLRPYCEVETEDLGKVKLCAYKPDQTAAQNADVTFCFVKDWDILCRFPGMDSRNIRKDMTFRDVKAVDLGDYDQDGWSEVVTICEYEILQEGAGRPDGLEARIYRFDEDGMPELDSELSAEVNRSPTTSLTERTESGLMTGSALMPRKLRRRIRIPTTDSLLSMSMTTDSRNFWSGERALTKARRSYSIRTENCWRPR